MQYVELYVPKKYLTTGASGDYIFTLPVYDQSYKVTIKFPDSSDGLKSLTGTRFPDYTTAYSLSAYEIIELSWSGLSESDKDIFVEFLKSFSNSFQPFVLMHIDEDSVPNIKRQIYGIILTNSVEINKDEFDLYNFSLKIIHN